MSDKEDTSNGTGMSADETKFLVQCLKHTTSGNIAVDMTAMAEALGYKNPRSIGNRITNLKKKHGLPISATNGKGSGANANAAASNGDAPNVPRTPNGKSRVKKAAPAGRKKAAAKKAVKKEEPADEDEEDAGEKFLVETPPRKEYTDAELLGADPDDSSEGEFENGKESPVKKGAVKNEQYEI